MSCKIDISAVRQNAERIVQSAGVPVYAVVKSDAYGLGAVEVIKTIADLVHRFCVFSLAEAVQYHLPAITNKPTLCLGPPGNDTAQDFLELGARPAVSTVAQAHHLRRAAPALCVDTGMQRFTCPPEDVAKALNAGVCREAFTHAVRPDHVEKLISFTGGRRRDLKLHAAGTALLENPNCRLDAVRPGLALYRGAVRIGTPLVEVRKSHGPAGYSGFQATHHGVIMYGYRRGLRPGPCRLNGRPSRVLEVGMQTAFVECAEKDRIGDEVVLIGEGLEADAIAPAWKCSPQEVLVSFLNGRER